MVTSEMRELIRPGAWVKTGSQVEATMTAKALNVQKHREAVSE